MRIVELYKTGRKALRQYLINVYVSILVIMYQAIYLKYDKLVEKENEKLDK